VCAGARASEKLKDKVQVLARVVNLKGVRETNRQGRRQQALLQLMLKGFIHIECPLIPFLYLAMAAYHAMQQARSHQIASIEPGWG
jgi:hypothetical protein